MFDALSSDCRKKFEPQIETILQTVLEFQVNCACFRGGKDSANFDGKVK